MPTCFESPGPFLLGRITRRPFRSSLRSSLSYPSAHPYIHLQAEMQDATARGTARSLKLEGLPAYETLLSGKTSTPSAASSSSRQRYKAPSSPSAPSPFSAKHLGPETPRTEEMRHTAEKERENRRRAAPSLAPFEAPVEVGLLEQRPLGLAEHLPGRRRDFVAIAQVELLAVRGVRGRGGAGADAFFGKGGEGVAEMQGRAGCLAGGGGFRGWGAQEAVWSRGPNIGPNSCRRVWQWSSGSQNLQALGLCNCSGTLPKLNAHMLRVPWPLPLRQHHPKQQRES